MSKISVVICTHNPRAEFLARVLNALRSQTLEYKNWELLLIDNGSEKRLSDHWDLSWHPRSRHIREDVLGLTPARLRGIRESKGDLIVFVDDDNVLSDDFLEQAAILSEQHPFLGALGAGVIEPEFQEEPPAELLSRLNMFAIRTVPAVVWSSNPKDYSSMPVGAGLCVTRCIADAYLKLISRLNVTDLVDRRGGRLFSGGDDLFSWTASWEGQGFGLFPQLRMTHLMLAKRFSQEHFLRLTHDHTFSHGVLRYLLSGTEPNPIDIFDYARMFLHLLRHGKFSFLCHWYSSQGEAGARRFINEHHLRPLEAGPQGEIMDRQPQFGAASGARV